MKDLLEKFLREVNKLDWEKEKPTTIDLPKTEDEREIDMELRNIEEVAGLEFETNKGNCQRYMSKDFYVHRQVSAYVRKLLKDLEQMK